MPLPLRTLLWGGLAALLAAPLVGMQLSAEVNWTASDFAIAGGILLVFGLGVEAIFRLTPSWPARFGWGLILTGLIGLGFAHLSVGIIGDGSDPANLAVLALPAIALVGVLASRARPAGMMVTAFALCAGQLALGVFADSLGQTIWLPTTVLAALWLVAGGLFAISARARSAAPH